MWTPEPGGIARFIYSVPDAPDAKLIKFGVRADNGNIHTEGLGGYHAVEGVSMVSREPAGAKGHGSVNREQRKPSFTHVFEKIPLQLQRCGQSATPHFGSDLPGGCGGDEDRVGTVRDSMPRSLAELGR